MSIPDKIEDLAKAIELLAEEYARNQIENDRAQRKSGRSDVFVQPSQHLDAARRNIRRRLKEIFENEWLREIKEQADVAREIKEKADAA